MQGAEGRGNGRVLLTKVKDIITIWGKDAMCGYLYVLVVLWEPFPLAEGKQCGRPDNIHERLCQT